MKTTALPLVAWLLAVYLALIATVGLYCAVSAATACFNARANDWLANRVPLALPYARTTAALHAHAACGAARGSF